MPDRKAFERPFDFRAMFGSGGLGAAAAASPAENHADEADEADERGDAAERCRRMAEEVPWESLKPLHNIMRPCRGELEFPHCTDLRLPAIRPRVYVFWGDSPCDCIEGDDTEIMFVLVYNPYRNLTLTDVMINRIRVVDSGGNAVPLLPDGSESIQLVPRGTYCFGDIAPCWFSFRQFVLRLRGAPPGTYRILIEGICFEVCHHRMTDECVTFEVCKD